MAKRGVGGTALGAAVCRLIEQFEPNETRLFDDPVVGELVGRPVRFLLGFRAVRGFAHRKMDATGVYGLQICRTRYIDDTVNAALAEGIDQLVILGAGLDTRAYRLPAASAIETFELDLAAVQENKRRRLQQHHRLTGHVRLIPIDFDTQELDGAFAGSSFDPSKRAVVVWEGVTQYLSEEAVHRTLAFVGKLAAGSWLVFTYVLQSVIEHRSGIRGADEILESVARRGAPWRFGMEPSEMEPLLKPWHLAFRADVGNADYQRTFLKSVKRELVVSEVERVASAQVVPGR